MLLAPLLVWGALEGVARIALDAIVPKTTSDSAPEWLVNAKEALRSGFFVPDDHAIWVLSPNYTQEFDGDGIYGKDTMRLNAFGHRSPPMSREKPDGVRRVMVLGGSHPFGMWVSSSEAYSAVLSELLNAAGPHRWEVMNAASPGHTTFQGKEYLLHTGWQFAPDVVVFDLGMNDELPLTVDYAAPDHEVAAVPGWAKATAEQARGSAVYLLLQRLLASSVGARKASGVRVPIEKRRENLQAVGESAVEHDAQILYVSQISVTAWDGPGDARCAYRPSADGFAPMVDVCAVFEAKGEDAGRFFVDPIHANAQGHRAIAEAVFKRMQELGLLE